MFYWKAMDSNGVPEITNTLVVGVSSWITSRERGSLGWQARVHWSSLSFCFEGLLTTLTVGRSIRLHALEGALVWGSSQTVMWWKHRAWKEDKEKQSGGGADKEGGMGREWKDSKYLVLVCDMFCGQNEFWSLDSYLFLLCLFSSAGFR